MELTFTGPVFTWRGPAPYYFVTVPPDEAAALDDASSLVTYGWGMIPASCRIGETEWTTSLWPKDGGYVLPLKVAVRRAERIDEDDVVEVTLTLTV